MPSEGRPVETLPQFLAPALAQARDRAIGERVAGDSWSFLSTAQLRRRVDSIACALRVNEIGAGDRVALIAQNCVDWVVADLGIVFAGCVCVPIFSTGALDQMQYILADCGAKLAFVERTADAARLRAAISQAPPIVAFDDLGPDGLAAFERAGAALLAADPQAPERLRAPIRPGDLAVLIYTSGTTGDPKGVMLTHGNLSSNARDAFAYAFPTLQPGQATLSVLPFAHIYEHTALIGYLARGAEFYVTTPERFVVDLRDARPVGLNLVPRIYERVLAALVAKSCAAGGVKAKLVPWALGVGRDYMRAKLAGGAGPALCVRYATARTLVLKKIRPALGLDRLDHAASGSATLHPDTALTFAAAGIVICEGYGLTETSPVVTTNRVSDNRFGTVGRPLPNVEVRIAADGEILCRGPNVMKGYFNRPTESPIDADGWFATGDVGELDADGYLRITDRKKELLKTSGGKYVAPARVEAAIKRSVYVGQVLVVGEARAHPAALIAPNWELVRRELALDDGSPPAEIAGRADVREFMRGEVIAQTADLASFEQVRRVALLPRDLTIEAGELSPTLKVRRRVVEARFGELIEAAYAELLAAREPR